MQGFPLGMRIVPFGTSSCAWARQAGLPEGYTAESVTRSSYLPPARRSACNSRAGHNQACHVSSAGVLNQQSARLRHVCGQGGMMSDADYSSNTVMTGVTEGSDSPVTSSKGKQLARRSR